jgi:uncharacterized membrane protein
MAAKASDGKAKRSERGKQKASSKAAQRAAAPRRRKLPNWPLLGLSLAGMALTGYLTAGSWLGEELAYCGEGSGCDIVQSSRWGTLLGLPTAFWGLLAYAALAHVAWRERNAERHWKFGWTIALVSTAISVYLTVISLVVLESTCTYCLASLGLLAAILAVTIFQFPKGMTGFRWPAWGGQTLLVALVVVGGLHLHYSGTFSPAAGPEDPYLKKLALHLAASDVKFYGAYW